MADDKALLLPGDEVCHEYGTQGSQNVQGTDHEAAGIQASATELQVYKRRFYIVLVFSLFAGCQGASWNIFGPITAVAEDMFGWNDGVIALLVSWGNITYILTAVLFSWMMQAKGIRLTVILSSLLLLIGCVLRCITTTPPQVTWLTHAAQIFSGLAGPVAMAGPPVISSIWFPAGQRTTATGLIIFLGVTFMSSSFIMGPYLVPQRNSTVFNASQEGILPSSVQNRSTFDIDAEKEDFQRYMYIWAGVAGVIFLLILAYFPDKPPRSPSMTASIARDSFFQGLKNLCGKAQYWQIAFVYGVTQGVLNNWGGVLGVDLKPHGVNQYDVGWIIFYTSMTSCVGGLIISRFSDVCIRYMKWITLALYIIGLGFLVWLALVLKGILPSSTGVLYVTAILGSATISATCPLLFEIGCETAYPVSEGTANGVLTLVNNISGLIFMFVLMIPNIDTTWMNWMLVGAAGVSIPMLLFMRDNYSRTNVDEQSRRLFLN